MSRRDFDRFVAPFGTHRLFGLTPQRFLETMGAHRWDRRKEAMAAIAAEPYKGITTDGTVLPDLYSLRDEDAPTETILNAVAHLLALLTPDQKAATLLPVDSIEKHGWQNGIPDFGSHGFRLDEVTVPVRDAALALLRASLSPAGYARARDVMRLNGYLGQLVGAPLLMGELCYRVHVFGTPSSSGPWGWQFSGHHLCMTFFILGRQMVSTPVFLGVEPNSCDEGEFAGASVFADEEYHGLLLAQGLDPGQRRKAVFADSILAADLPPGRHHRFDGLCLGGAYRDNQVVPYEGVTGADLTARQWRDLLDLAQRYLGTLPAGPLAAKMEDLDRHRAETRFCWAGGLDPDSVFYYRIQSPVTMIEFDHHWGVVLDNPRPERFHIHTTVRTPNGNDFGIDLLRLHYLRSEHHGREAETDQGAHGHDHAHDHHHHHHEDGHRHHHHDDGHHHHHGADHAHGAQGHAHHAAPEGEAPADAVTHRHR